MSSPWLRMRFSEAVEVNPRRTVKRGTIAPFVDMATLSTEAPHVRPSRSKSAGAGGSRFRNGDTLFARITPCTENGKTGLVDGLATGEVGTGSTEFIVLGPRHRLTLARFVCYLAKNPTFRSFAISQMRGTSGRQRVPASVFDDYVVGVPSLPEQRKIAAILSSVDAAIEKTQAIIEQVQVVKRGLMQELLTRGLPGRHARFKRTEIGEIPEQWDVVEMASVASVERGKFAHRPRNEPRFYGGQYPFIQTGDVAACDGFLRTYGQTLNEDGLALSRLFPSGTILLTIAANIGSTGIATFDVAFPDSLVGIQPGPRVDTRFLELVLQDRKRVLDRFAPESAQKNINLNTLRPLKIPLPDMSEQTKIARSVWSVIDLRKSTRDHLEGLTLVKSALMSILLTGELRVTPDPEPE